MATTVPPDPPDAGPFPALGALPHGGTVADFRFERARWAAQLTAARVGLLTDRPRGIPATDAERLRFEELVESAANAWGIVALLEWLGRDFGAGTAYRAAAILQEIGINGEPWDETLLDVPGRQPARGGGAGEPAP